MHLDRPASTRTPRGLVALQAQHLEADPAVLLDLEQDVAALQVRSSCEGEGQWPWTRSIHCQKERQSAHPAGHKRLSVLPAIWRQTSDATWPLMFRLTT